MLKEDFGRSYEDFYKEDKLTRVSHKKLTDKIRNSGLAYNTFLVTEKRVRSTLREHSQEEIAKLIDNGKNRLNHMKTQSEQAQSDS